MENGNTVPCGEADRTAGLGFPWGEWMMDEGSSGRYRCNWRQALLELTVQGDDSMLRITTEGAIADALLLPGDVLERIAGLRKNLRSPGFAFS